MLSFSSAQRPHTSLVSVVCLGGAVAASAAAAFWCFQLKPSWQGWHSLIGSSQHVVPVVDGVAGCIGNTPLIRINSLSEATGCEVRAVQTFISSEPADAHCHLIAQQKQQKLLLAQLIAVCTGAGPVTTSATLPSTLPAHLCAQLVSCRS